MPRQTSHLLILITTALLIVSSTTDAEPLAIGSIHLRMDPTDAKVLVRKDPYDKSSFAVTLIDGNKQLNGRIKVIGSSSRTLEKRSLYIKLDKGLKWHGQSRIALNALGSDPTLMRNRIVRDIYLEIGEVGPRTSYQNVYINDALQGVYLQIDWIDRSMFKRDGLGGEGQLFHPNDKYYCGDLDKKDKIDLEDCWFHFTPPFGDYTALKKLVNEVDATPVSQFDRFMEKNFNVDSVINWIAVNVLVADGDTYNKNYFLYLDDVTGKWTVVPWDYDLTFGRTYDPFLPPPHDIFNDSFEYFYPPELGAYNPLKMKLLMNPVLLSRFRERLAHLMGLKKEGDKPGFGIFSPNAMSRRIAELRAQLLPEIQRDPFLRDHQDEFFENAEAIHYFTLARYSYLKTAIFGNTPWDPNQAQWHPELVPPPGPYPDRLQALAEGTDQVAAAGEGYGYMLAVLKPEAPSQTIGISAVSLFDQVPLQLPPGVNASQCIRRTWRVTLSYPNNPIQGTLTLEYLQENSHRNELGNIKKESSLQLWNLNGDEWRQLPAHINPLSNTLTTTGLVLEPDKTQSFVACTPETITGHSK